MKNILLKMEVGGGVSATPNGAEMAEELKKHTVTVALTLEQVDQVGAGGHRQGSDGHSRQDGSSSGEAGGFSPFSESVLRLLRARRGIFGKRLCHICIQYGPVS